LMMICCCLCW